MAVAITRAENDVGGPGCQFDVSTIANSKEIPDFNPPLEQVYLMQLAWAQFCASQGSVDAAESKFMNHMRKVDPEMCKVFWGDSADNNVDEKTGQRTFRCAKRLQSEDSRPGKDRNRKTELREGDKDISEIEDAMNGGRSGDGLKGGGGMTGMLGGMDDTNLGDMAIMKLLRGFGPGEKARPAGDADSKLLAEMFKDLSNTKSGVKEFSIDGGNTAVKTARIPEPTKAAKTVRSGAAVRSKLSSQPKARRSSADCEVAEVAPTALTHSLELPHEEPPFMPPSLAKSVSLIRSR